MDEEVTGATLGRTCKKTKKITRHKPASIGVKIISHDPGYYKPVAVFAGTNCVDEVTITTFIFNIFPISYFYCLLLLLLLSPNFTVYLSIYTLPHVRGYYFLYDFLVCTPKIMLIEFRHSIF